jgi:hypothetical protein
MKAWRDKNNSWYKKKYYREHREHLQKQSRVQYKRDPQKRMAATYRWRGKNLKKWREYDNQWKRKARKVDPNKTRKKEKAYRAKNAKRIRAWFKAYYDKPNSKYKAYLQAWRKRNVERLRTYRFNRENKYRGWDGLRKKLHAGEIVAKWKRVRRLCYICGKYLDELEIHIDHVDPCGTNNLGNLMPTHKGCNSRKSDKRHFKFARPDLLAIA